METVITIIITVFGAILGAVFMPAWDKFSIKLKCNMLTDNNEELVQKVINFYIDRIPFNERIPPNFIRFYLESKEHSVKHIYELKAKCSISNKPIHVLLHTQYKEEIVGILKLIYLCDLNSFFIAYYAARPSDKASSSDILNSMLDYINYYLQGCTNIYYEICESDEDKAKLLAKDRLFRHYAQSRRFFVKCLIPSYLQPEVSAFDEGFINPIKGKLYGISKTSNCLELYSSKIVVDSLFKNVYADSFFNADKGYYDEYLEYLELVKSEIQFPERVS